MNTEIPINKILAGRAQTNHLHIINMMKINAGGGESWLVKGK